MSYQVPPRHVPADDAGYFEKIVQAIFQAGFSWEVIRNKWPNFRAAFAEFDVARVAAFTDVDVERLLEDRQIVRNGRKIEATIQNARSCRELIDQYGSLHAWLRTMDELPYAQREKRFCKQFKFMGPMGAYFFFWSVGESVPEYHEWQAQRQK